MMELTAVCRTCLRIPKQSINLFENNTILNKIKIVSSVKIINVQELPNQICEECFKLINSFYNFHKVIINTDKDLNTRLETLKKTNFLSKPRKNNGFAITIEQETFHNENENIPKPTTAKQKSPVKNPRCTFCNRQFITFKQLSDHKRHHGARAICNICGTETLAHNLNKHILTQHSGEPAQCTECGKLCKHAEALRSHKRYNHTEKVFACEKCGATFSLLSRFKTHMRRHNDPDFRRKCCAVCGKIVLSIKNHMLTHTGERPYICAYCNKGFTSTKNLKVHIRLHTNERPYVCKYCGNSYRQSVSLKSHLRSKHNLV